MGGVVGVGRGHTPANLLPSGGRWRAPRVQGSFHQHSHSDHSGQNHFATTDNVNTTVSTNLRSPVCLSGTGVVHRCVAGWGHGRHGWLARPHSLPRLRWRTLRNRSEAKHVRNRPIKGGRDVTSLKIRSIHPMCMFQRNSMHDTTFTLCCPRSRAPWDVNKFRGGISGRRWRRGSLRTHYPSNMATNDLTEAVYRRLLHNITSEVRGANREVVSLPPPSFPTPPVLTSIVRPPTAVYSFPGVLYARERRPGIDIFRYGGWDIHFRIRRPQGALLWPRWRRGNCVAWMFFHYQSPY